MSHRYESILIHCAFSTKDRKPMIPEPMKPKLWAYIGGIARTNEFKALAVGGTLDHVHALLSLPATLQILKAVQLIKGGSSKWLNDHLPRRSFAWQDSYGVFSIGISQLKDTFSISTLRNSTTRNSDLRKNSGDFWIAMGSWNSGVTELSVVPFGDSVYRLHLPAVKTAGYFHPSRFAGLHHLCAEMRRSSG